MKEKVIKIILVILSAGILLYILSFSYGKIEKYYSQPKINQTESDPAVFVEESKVAKEEIDKEEIKEEKKIEPAISAESITEDEVVEIREIPAIEKIAIKDSDNSLGVKEVIDGDTIVLTSGEKVRYIGIDSPELNKKGSADDECLAWTARLKNMEILSKGNLELIADSSADKDKYGRLLRYVYVDGVFVNAELARLGLAEEFFCQPGWQNCPVSQDLARKKIIENAANEAKELKLGIYSAVCQK